jgi:hypothetical protein
VGDSVGRESYFFVFFAQKAPSVLFGSMFAGPDVSICTVPLENLHRIGVKSGDSARCPELIEDQDVMNEYRPSGWVRARQSSRDHHSVEAHRLGAPGLRNVGPYFAAKEVVLRSALHRFRRSRNWRTRRKDERERVQGGEAGRKRIKDERSSSNDPCLLRTTGRRCQLKEDCRTFYLKKILFPNAAAIAVCMIYWAITMPTTYAEGQEATIFGQAVCQATGPSHFEVKCDNSGIFVDAKARTAYKRCGESFDHIMPANA